MNPVVSIPNKEIKSSLKRNAVGKILVSSAIVSIVYYTFSLGLFSIGTLLILVSIYILIQIIADYFISYSIIVDRSIIQLLRRGIASRPSV